MKRDSERQLKELETELDAANADLEEIELNNITLKAELEDRSTMVTKLEDQLKEMQEQVSKSLRRSLKL